MKSTKLIFAAVAVVCVVAVGAYVASRQARDGNLHGDTPRALSKPQAAGQACFSAAKTTTNKADLLYEGADVLKRSGNTYTLRVRTLDKSSDSFRREIFTCEITDRDGNWSIVRLEPAG